MSPSLSKTSLSLLSGEKWHTQLLIEMQVGKAIPFLASLSFLKTFPVSSIMRLSPDSHIVITLAPAIHFSLTSLSTPEVRNKKKIFIYLFIKKNQYYVATMLV